MSKCGDCVPCPSLHSLPALCLPHSCWALQTLAAGSVWGRWDMALLGWNRGLLSPGVLIVLPLKFPALRILRGLSRGKLGEMDNALWQIVFPHAPNMFQCPWTLSPQITSPSQGDRSQGHLVQLLRLGKHCISTCNLKNLKGDLKPNGFCETLQVESRSSGLANHFLFARQLSAFPFQGHDHMLLHSPGALLVWQGTIKACGPWDEPLGC